MAKDIVTDIKDSIDAHPTAGKPDKAKKDKLVAYLKAKGAKDEHLTFLSKDFASNVEMAEDVRQWCATLQKATV